MATAPTPPPTSGAPRAPERPPAKRRVAVIAVHGVAHHPPGETEDAVADLLLSLPARQYDAPRLYESFRDIPIQIPLQRLKVKATPEMLALNQPKESIFQEESAIFARHTKHGHHGVGDIGQQFTGMLLHDYPGGADGNAYITTRLEGRRPADLTDVDIYEVLWADLAKPNTGFVKFFVALFQLLSHLASLSRLALDSGAHEGCTPIWKAFRTLHRLSVRVFQIALPLTQLLLLIAILSCAAASSPFLAGQQLFPLVGGAIAGIAAGYLLFTRTAAHVPRNPLWWSLRIFIPPLLGAGLVYAFLLLLKHFVEPLGTRVDIGGSLTLWLLVGGPLLYFVLENYEDVRPGVKVTGWILYGLSLLTFIALLIYTSTHPFACEQNRQTSCSPVVLASFWTAKLLVAAVRASWGVLILLANFAFVLGSLAWRQLPRASDQQARARAAVRTSRLTLALPATLFMLVVLVLWSGIFALGSKVEIPAYTRSIYRAPLPILPLETVGQYFHLLPTSAQIDCWTMPPHDPAKPSGIRCSDTPKDVADHPIYNALAWAVGPYLPVTLLLLAVAGVLLGLWVLPGAVTERFPPRTENVAPRTTDTPASTSLGAWLSTGLDATRISTLLVWGSIFLAPVVLLLVIHLRPKWYAVYGANFENFTRILVVWSAAIAVALIIALVKDGGSVLGILLDVDTYLRTSPTAAPPRAKIFERYISTLRYVDDYKDAQQRPYDSIVIFSHSLGALISGDVFHFLHSPYSGEPALQNKNISFFTFGNPQRQLLARFFPYLYDWVRPHPDNALGPLPAPAPAPPADIPNSQHPNPHALGLTRWISAYRSGDYVGRQLWLDAWYQRTPANAPAPHPTMVSSPDGTRQEFCIGAGAHTHYMDDTAPDIAAMLDTLI